MMMNRATLTDFVKRFHPSQSRASSYVAQAGLISVAVALPLLAFAQFAVQADASERMSAKSIQTLEHRPTVPLETKSEMTQLSSASISPSTSRDCSMQNWPNYSPDCLRGKNASIEPRRIAIVAEQTPAIEPQPPKALPTRSSKKSRH